MLKNRIIPCLDVKNGRVVKGINFVDLVDAGDPVEQAKIYDEQGADELCFLDITASNENRDIILDTVKKTAEKCFMPLTVGGGVRTLEDISRWIKMGIDKVVMGTAAVENTELLKTACNKFKNKIAVSLDVKDGLIALSGWKKQTNISAIDFIKKIQNFGVSRIIYTDINRDGTKQGPNIKDTVELSSKTKIPLVISGGVSSLEDIKKIKSLSNSNIEGVIIGKAIYDGDIKINDLAKLI